MTLLLPALLIYAGLLRERAMLQIWLIEDAVAGPSTVDAMMEGLPEVIVLVIVAILMLLFVTVVEGIDRSGRPRFELPPVFIPFFAATFAFNWTMWNSNPIIPAQGTVADLVGGSFAKGALVTLGICALVATPAWLEYKAKAPIFGTRLSHVSLALATFLFFSAQCHVSGWDDASKSMYGCEPRPMVWIDSDDSDVFGNYELLIIRDGVVFLAPWDRHAYEIDAISIHERNILTMEFAGHQTPPRCK